MRNVFFSRLVAALCVAILCLLPASAVLATEAREYTVTYHANGGTGSVPATNTYRSGKEVVVQFTPAPTKAHAVFIGWARENPDAAEPEFTSVGQTFSLRSSTDLYAVYERQRYYILYDGNGCDETASVPTDDDGYWAEEEASILFSPAPTKSGSRFLGWAKSASAEKPDYPVNVSRKISITGSMTLYAVWSDGTQKPRAPLEKALSWETNLNVNKNLIGDFMNLSEALYSILGDAQQGAALTQDSNGKTYLTVLSVKENAPWQENALLAKNTAVINAAQALAVDRIAIAGEDTGYYSEINNDGTIGQKKFYTNNLSVMPQANTQNRLNAASQGAGASLQMQGAKRLRQAAL